ncbi:MAG: alcohol dehydrogenase [Bacteroidetes bacterium]|nr:MAG: alcohol dehydrogenase [Bacteroidota bacterium]
MRAMIFEKAGQPLKYSTLPAPQPGKGQALIKVSACVVCRTDIHILDGDLQSPKLPLVPGHEIIGTVVDLGAGNSILKVGDKVGVPWLGFTCGICDYCKNDRENLCVNARFTGYTIDGGFAEYTVADQRFCFPLPDVYMNPLGAPLLCAGLIGYRSYKMIDASAHKIGIYGFGAAAHIITQVAVYQKKKVFAFTRTGDNETQQFALQLGCSWAGASTERPPEPLDASIIFAQAGSLVPKALEDLDKGGLLVCGGIHMSDIPSFPYRILWEERIIRSVANLTRKDGTEFLNLAVQVPVKTQVELFKLPDTNEAIDKLRNGKIQGAAVIVMD